MAGNNGRQVVLCQHGGSYLTRGVEASKRLFGQGGGLVLRPGVLDGVFQVEIHSLWCRYPSGRRQGLPALVGGEGG